VNKVYIVIPVHNRINDTIKCLDSIYRQNYKDIQVVVIDDGSTDSTKKKISIISLGYVDLSLLYCFSIKHEVVGFNINTLQVEKLNET
jgi:glycosyltransferase involved in cell wall biosynthesis